MIETENGMVNYKPMDTKDRCEPSEEARRFFPRTLNEFMALPTTWFWISSLQNLE